MRASFEMPKTSLFGMYAMAICKWETDINAVRVGPSHRDWRGIYRANGKWVFTRGTNLASEWDQMVFAEAGDVDVTNEDHFIMVLSKDSIIDHVCGRRSKIAFQRLFGGGGAFDGVHARKKK